MKRSLWNNLVRWYFVMQKFCTFDESSLRHGICSFFLSFSRSQVVMKKSSYDTIFLSKRGFNWKDDHLCDKWCFHLKKLTTWEREKKRTRNAAPKSALVGIYSSKYFWLFLWAAGKDAFTLKHKLLNGALWHYHLSATILQIGIFLNILP